MPDRLRRTAAPIPVGIVHLGLGAFFRAHGALYIEDAVAAGGGDWGILGVSLQSPTMRDQLMPQGGTYTTVELSPDRAATRHVQIVQDVRVAREDPEAVLAAMAAPSVRIVTLTVTEKGYCHEPSSGRLRLDHPDIEHDLASPLPRSAPGYLVRALERRRAAGRPPFTVLTCDNLPSNGHVVRQVVLDFAAALDPALARWIESEGRFPSTMVDRIVPATKPEDIARAEALTGLYDAAPVMHEPFRQWVVEDDFVGGVRPDLGAVGVQLVGSVTEFEHMKLRMLNGTHSSLAYLGYLAGHETISDCMRDGVFVDLLGRLWRDEIGPVLAPPPGIRLSDYAAELATRYANPAIRHRTWQIAMDGSQKLPQRILGTIADNLAAGRACPGLVLAVAAWTLYVRGIDLEGKPIDVKDPLAAQLARRANAPQPVNELLSMRAIFPEPLAAGLAPQVEAARQRLLATGVRASICDIVGR
jgi:fructuronate reductase